jgi:hypothetical protein
MSAGRAGPIFNVPFVAFPQAAGSLSLFIRGTAVTVLCNWNDMSKDTLYRLGQHEFGVRGDDPTPRVSVKGG